MSLPAWLGPAQKLSALVVVFVTWQLLALSGRYPAFILPSPGRVFTTWLGDVASGQLLVDVGISLGRQMAGFLLCLAVGIPVGMLLGAFRWARTTLLLPLQLVYPIPGLAWLPLAILWLGVGDRAIVFVIFFSAVWPLLFNTMAGVANLPGMYVRAAQALGVSRRTYLLRVVVPGALPFILAGLRLCYGVSWRMIVGAEMIAASSGLGFAIDNARSLLRGDRIIAGMITIGLLGYLVERFAFGALEAATVDRWGTRAPS